MRSIGEELARLEARLACLAREESALRLRLGQVLEVLGRGGVFELGFSSLAAYAIERCERSGRWAEGARCLARRVEGLPELRRAIAVGSVSWSMGEELARVAKPSDEARWIELAASRTVRQVRGLVAAALEEVRNGVAKAVVCATSVGEPASDAANSESKADAAGGAGQGDVCTAGDELCTLTYTVDREEGWLFEATRSLLDRLGVRGAEEQSEALLAEAQGALLDRLPAGALDPDSLAPDRWAATDDARRRWVGELARWRAEAEVMCERNIAGQLSAGQAHGEVAAFQVLEQAVVGGGVARGLSSAPGAGACAARAFARRARRASSTGSSARRAPRASWCTGASARQPDSFQLSRRC
ncbi:MAG TPA: hypothetical protein VNN80_29675, partial [Polyangiaceae bacterium]|nr:hypothetical protein [Polyangiaceae bacterium]